MTLSTSFSSSFQRRTPKSSSPFCFILISKCKIAEFHQASTFRSWSILASPPSECFTQTLCTLQVGITQMKPLARAVCWIPEHWNFNFRTWISSALMRWRDAKTGCLFLIFFQPNRKDCERTCNTLGSRRCTCYCLRWDIPSSRRPWFKLPRWESPKVHRQLITTFRNTKWLTSSFCRREFWVRSLVRWWKLSFAWFGTVCRSLTVRKLESWVLRIKGTHLGWGRRRKAFIWDFAQAKSLIFATWSNREAAWKHLRVFTFSRALSVF